MNLPAKPPCVIVLCVNLEIEALDENIGRWETTWFDCHILHFKCFNLVGYDLYHAPTSYNILLGRPSFNTLGTVVFIPHLAMKFPSPLGDILTIHGAQRLAR